MEILSFHRCMCTINVDPMIYGFWNIRCDRQKFLSFWAIFCPFSPPDNPENRNLKLKKTPGDIVILQISTINDNFLMYGSWDMERDRQNFLSFWTVFCPFTLRRPPPPPPPPSPPSRKSKFWKHEKNNWRYYHFTNITDCHIMHGSSDMEWNGQKFLSFWTVFCPFTP